jgi:putative peptidoglycan lipid II flippase
MKQYQMSNDQTEKITGNRAISIAAMIMMGSVFLSRITGLLREQVLAAYGGTGFEIDAYVTAFFIPELLNHFLAGGFLSVTFIPIFQKYAVAGEYPKAWRTFSNLMTIGSLLFIILIPVAIFFTPALLGHLGPHISDPSRLPLTVRLTRIILPAQLFFYLGAFLMAVQMAERKFFLPAMAPLCYNAGIILGGVFLGPILGIEGFAWGVLIGAFTGNVLVQLPGALRIGMRFKPRIDFRDPDLSRYIILTVPLVLGVSMSFSNEIFFRLFGSWLDEGGTASVNYALRTMMIVTAVFGQASGMAFYPFMSRLAAEKRFGEITSLLQKALSRIAVFLVPVSTIMIALSYRIIALLYQHGHFGATSTARTAPVLAIYLTGAFVWSASMITVRCFYALQNTWLPMVVSSVVAAGSIPLYILFSRQLGAVGIALAGVAGMFGQFLALQFLWLHRHPGTSKRLAGVIPVFKIVVPAAAGGVVAYYLAAMLGTLKSLSSGLTANATVIIMSALPAFLLTFTGYELLGVQRMKETAAIFLRKKQHQA